SLRSWPFARINSRSLLRRSVRSTATPSPPPLSGAELTQATQPSRSWNPQSTRMPTMSDFALPAEGILPDQWLRKAVGDGLICSERTIPETSYQPASLDLRLGERAHRLRCSFLPGPSTVAERLKEYEMGHVD